MGLAAGTRDVLRGVPRGQSPGPWGQLRAHRGCRVPLMPVPTCLRYKPSLSISSASQELLLCLTLASPWLFLLPRPQCPCLPQVWGCPLQPSVSLLPCQPPRITGLGTPAFGNELEGTGSMGRTKFQLENPPDSAAVCELVVLRGWGKLLPLWLLQGSCGVGAGAALPRAGPRQDKGACRETVPGAALSPACAGGTGAGEWVSSALGPPLGCREPL